MRLGTVQKIRQQWHSWAIVGIGLVSSAFLQSDRAIALNQVELEKSTKTETPTSLIRSPQAEGLHFYGQAPQANELGSDYLLYDVKGEQVQGVIFRPQSEYACFQGGITPGGLELAIAGPYDETVVSYAIAFNRETVQVAGAMQTQVSLEGFHAISTDGETAIGESEQHLLAQCR